MTDNDCPTFDCKGLKLMVGRLSLPKLLFQEANAKRVLRIITYSPPSIRFLEYLHTKLQPPSIKIVVHRTKEFTDKARKLKKRFSSIKIALHPEVHSKVVLIAPDDVIFGSANFCGSDWHETCALMHSPQAYQCVLKEWQKLWKVSTSLEKITRLPSIFDKE